MTTSRVIAHVRGDRPGPTLILIGGVHGNEPAGVVAARTVLAGIAPADVTGEAIAIVGNLRAIAAGKRYIERDLNRMWTAERATGGIEAVECAELSAVVDEVRARATGPVHVVDLHSTSAEGFPFAVVGASEASQAFARQFPLTGIVGLEQHLPGVLTGYLGGLGCITIAIEGGQNATPAAAANLEACVTLALAATVAPGLAGVTAAREHLTHARGELPHTIEIVSRHAIRPEDFFRMEPGFANIQRTAVGTLLARDYRGEIRAPFDGVVLLPLYQPQGDDGFFYGRAIN